MDSGIYCLSISGRHYIGQSKNVYVRRGQHLSDLRSGRHRNQVLQRAFNKHGESAVSWRLLARCPTEYLDALESHFIQNSQLDLCNMTDGGRGTSGYIPGPETRQRMSVAGRGRKKSALHRKRIGDAHRGRPCPPERRAKISASLSGKPGTFLGRKHADSTKALISLSRVKASAFVSPSGDVVDFGSNAAAGEYFGVSPNYISMLLRGSSAWPNSGPLAGWSGRYKEHDSERNPDT